MSNTTIKIKRSLTTNTPTSLNIGEPAYSYSSNTFYIGSPAGTGALPIAGFESFNRSILAFDRSNAAFAAANSTLLNIIAAYDHANSAFVRTNAAFIHANSGFIQANAVFTHANSAYQSQNATGQYANAAFTVANGAFIHANSGFIHANAAYLSQNATGNVANAAFVHVNTAFNVANSGFIQANASFNHANAAFASANNVAPQVQPAFNTANAAFIHANSGFIKTNSAFDHANAAFANANGAFASANAAYIQANSGFIKTNSAFDHANAAFASANNVAPQVQPAFNTANAAFLQANSAIVHAQSAFNKANNADINALSAGAYANTSFVHANASFVHANASFTATNAAYAHANSGFIQANSGFIHANSAYADLNTVAIYANTSSDKANSAAIYANGAFNQANSVYLPSVTRLSVTNSGAAAYLFDQYSGNNPTLYVSGGETIAFALNVSGHPFMIRVSSGGSNYSTGLTHVATNGTVSTDSGAQGQVAGTLYWKVPFDLVGSTYVYQCSIHGGMVGSIVIQQPASLVAANTQFAFNQSNAAFMVANSGFIHANSAYQSQNATGQYANAAFVRANNSLDANNGGTVTGNVTVTVNITSGNVIVSAGGQLVFPDGTRQNTAASGTGADSFARDVANASFNHANSGFIQANAAFNHANSAYTSQNATGQYANAAFIHVNSAFAFANTISGGAAIDNVARDAANSAGIYANAAFVRANNSLNANLGGTITANVVINANLQVANVTTNNFVQFSDGTRQFTANAAAANVSLQTFTTTATGAESTYNLGFTPAGSNAAVFVSIGGIVQTDGIDYAIQPANSTISFDTAPPAGEIIRVTGLQNIVLLPNPNVTVSVFETTANGNQITFGLPFYPASKEALFVTIDGVVQPLTAYEINTTANTITFDENPGNGELVRVTSFYTAVNPYLILSNSITFDHLQSSVGTKINASFNHANSGFNHANAAFSSANSAASTGKAIAMSIVFGG